MGFRAERSHLLSKPTTQEGLEAALNRVKEYSTPRRKKLLIVEDNPGRAVQHPRAVWVRKTLTLTVVDTGEEALARVEEENF